MTSTFDKKAWWQAEAEEKERRRKEKLEAHLYTIIKVARDQDFTQQIGSHQFFDLVDHDKVLLTSQSAAQRLVLFMFAADYTLHLSALVHVFMHMFRDAARGAVCFY